MAAQPKRVEAITVDTDRWNGRDFQDLKRVLGRPINQAALREADMEMVYGMAWIELRRLDPKLTFDDVLDIAIVDLPKMGLADAPKKLRAVVGDPTT